jgi:hypothetical protein
VCFGNICACIYSVLYSFIYVYLSLFYTSVRLLPPSENSIEVNNNNNNSNNNNNNKNDNNENNVPN